MKARDVLATAVAIPPKKSDPDALTAALLATTPDGEGVCIAPDGTLMGRCAEWPTRHTDHYCDDPECDGNGWVPIEGGDRA